MCKVEKQTKNVGVFTLVEEFHKSETVCYVMRAKKKVGPIYLSIADAMSHKNEWFEEITTTPRVLGSSYDYRTNRWQVKCPKCEHSWEPQTTMMGTQGLTCPKCSTELVARYNDEPPVVKIVEYVD